MSDCFAVATSWLRMSLLGRQQLHLARNHSRFSQQQGAKPLVWTYLKAQQAD
jgi:hypothetical protein